MGENRPQVGAGGTANPDDQAAGVERACGADEQLLQVLGIAHATELRAKPSGCFQLRRRLPRLLSRCLRLPNRITSQHELAIRNRRGARGDFSDAPLSPRHDKRKDHDHETARGGGSAQSVGLPPPAARFGLVERLGFSKARRLYQLTRLDGGLATLGEHHVASHQLLSGTHVVARPAIDIAEFRNRGASLQKRFARGWAVRGCAQIVDRLRAFIDQRCDLRHPEGHALTRRHVCLLCSPDLGEHAHSFARVPIEGPESRPALGNLLFGLDEEDRSGAGSDHSNRDKDQSRRT